MKRNPVILAFDASAQHCSVAVVQGETMLAHRHETMAKGQAERLMGLITDTLEEAELTLENVDVIGVGIGPGNFTGIRIAVSAARGLALGLGCPAVGISGFDALHYGQEGPCSCVIDARRNEVYLKTYGPGEEQSTPRLMPAEDISFGAGLVIGQGGEKPKFTQAEAIARLAAERVQTERRKPAPLYIRPADAAPARDIAPQILP